MDVCEFSRESTQELLEVASRKAAQTWTSALLWLNPHESPRSAVVLQLTIRYAAADATIQRDYLHRPAAVLEEFGLGPNDPPINAATRIRNNTLGSRAHAQKSGRSELR